MVKSICKTNLMILSVVFAASATTGVVVQAAEPQCTLLKSTIAECQARIAQEQARIAQEQARIAQEQARIAQEQARFAQEQARFAQDQAILELLQAGKFVAVYTDKSGLSWSKALPGNYTNGCMDAKDHEDNSQCTFETNTDGSLKLVDGLRQVKISGSLAAQACDKVGGRLPTKAEIESLIRNFKSTEWYDYGPTLTPTGRADMQAKFGDDMNKFFWSSSIYPGYPYLVFVLDGYNGSVMSYDPGIDVAVRCVSGR